MNHYRDPLAGLRSQVAIKRALLEERERDVTPVFRALMPRPLRAVLEELRPRALVDEESLEAMSSADGALDGILAAYDEARALLPELRECAAEIADPAQPKVSPPWLIEERRLLVIRRDLEDRLRNIDPAGAVARHGDFAYVARFHVGSAPYTFVVALGSSPDDQHLAHVESYLRTSIPPALAPLVVRRQHIHHDVGKALHLTREIEIGDEAFDSNFWITGDVHTAALLTPRVRRAFGSNAGLGPLLQLSDGLVTVSWSGYIGSALDDVLPDGVLNALIGLRAAIDEDDTGA